jgi:hypothetical protein
MGERETVCRRTPPLYRSVESFRENLLLDDVQQLDFEHQRGAWLDDRR